MRSKRAASAGFSLLEIMIALVILALVATNISMVLRTGGQAYRSGALSTSLEDQGDQALDRMSLALMGARMEDLIPISADDSFTPSVDYRVSLGVQDGVEVRGDEEAIFFVPAEGAIRWTQQRDGEQVRSMIWSRHVPYTSLGEASNGIDDNGNGLVDEGGLCFQTAGPEVRIHLSLRKTDTDGRAYEWTDKRVVTPRN